MNTSLAHKDHIMPDDEELRFIKSRIEEAKIFQKRIKNAQTYFESAVRDIAAFDEQHGTEYSSQFRQQPLTGSKARDTKLVLRIVSEHSFRYTKDELAQMVRNEGGGSATLPEARAVGYLASGIEHMIGKGTLVRRKDGKIGLP